MADMNVFVRLSLKDALSGPAQKAAASLKGIGAAATQAGSAATRGAAGIDRAGIAAGRVIAPAASAGRSLHTLAGGARDAGSASATAATSVSRLAGLTGKLAEGARRAAVALKEMNASARASLAGVDTKRLAADGRREVLDAHRSAMGGIMTAAGLYFPLKRQADYELKLTRYGNVAGYQDDEQGTFGAKIDRINSQLRGEAKATRNYAGELLAVVDTLVARGMAPEEALKASQLIGKSATATGAEAYDLAQMYYALNKNLGIGEEQMPKAFDVATQSGKLGGFELKDMAKWYPELTVGYGQMGQKGIEPLATLSAMLQVAREGAATPDKAANNVANIIQKLFIKETRKNFEKAMGVDFGEEMQAATQAGTDPILHLLTLIDDFMAKNDDNMFLLGDLFADRQALDGLRVLLAKRQKIEEIRQKSLAAEGTVERDFERVSKTFSMRAKGWLISLDNLVNTLSQTPAEGGKGVFGWLEEQTSWLDKAAKASPRATTWIVNTGLALVGLAAAGRAAKWIGGGLKVLAAGVLRLGGAIARSLPGKVLGGLGAGLLGGALGGLLAGAKGLSRATALAYRFAGALGVAKMALRSLGRLVGIGLAVEGLSLLVDNWSKLKAFAAEPLKFSAIWPEAPGWLKWLLGTKAQAGLVMGDGSFHTAPGDRPASALERLDAMVNGRAGPAADSAARTAASGPAVPTAVGGLMEAEGMTGAPAGITVEANGPTVTFKQAPPSISVNAPITIHMQSADPGAVGAAVSSHLNSVARGALHDGVNE